MPIRVTTKHKKNRTILQVDGVLRSPETQELIRECDAWAAPVVLDLSQLDGADEGGVNALLGLARKGAALYRVSPYLRLLLKFGAVRN
jgi:hypothetical protein